MKPKKTESADVDKKSGMFLKIGLIIALGVCILAFQWTKYDRSIMDLNSNLQINESEEIIDVTKQEIKMPVAPPPPELQIVSDDVQIDESQPDIMSADLNQNEAIDLPPVITDQGEDYEDDHIPFTIVEDMPSFPGGEEALYRYLQANIKYPEVERENGIQGQVIVSFVVGRDGSVSDAKILKPVTPNINNEALRVVQSMPKWNPGKQRGKPVRVQVTIPIRFTLN